jgi:hypothetical protein
MSAQTDGFWELVDLIREKAQAERAIADALSSVDRRASSRTRSDPWAFCFWP